MRDKILSVCTSGRCLWAIVIIVIANCVPIPAKWDMVLDGHGSTLCDYIFFISGYLILTICLFVIVRQTNDWKAKILFFLSFGKLIDQFYNPYGYHVTELLWDIAGIVWTLYNVVKCRRGKK